MKQTLRQKFNFYKANNTAGIGETMLINTMIGVAILVFPRIVTIPLLAASLSKYVTKSKMSKPCWSDSYIYTNGQDFIYDYDSLKRLNRVDLSKQTHKASMEYSKAGQYPETFEKKRLSQKFVSALTKSTNLTKKLEREMKTATEKRQAKIEKQLAKQQQFRADLLSV